MSSHEQCCITLGSDFLVAKVSVKFQLDHSIGGTNTHWLGKK